MNFLDLAKQRYSCRKIASRPVENEKIEKIIEAGLLAPTAVNKQPIQIFRMDSEEAKEAVRSCTKCHFGADTFLIVGARQEDGWVRPFDGRPFSQVDASIAAAHMMLEIQDLGLATTWVGYFDAPRLQQLCPGLQGWDLIALFPIGYPEEGPSPRHSQRKCRDELVTVL